MATEKAVHNFYDMCDQLKECGWEYTLTEKEKTAIVKDAEIPPKCFEKMKLAITVGVLFTIDSATVMPVHQNNLYSRVRLSHKAFYTYACHTYGHF